jgi:hypothetical protein
MQKSSFTSTLFIVAAVCLLAAGFAACKKSIEFNDAILITGTETNRLVRFTVENVPSSFAVTATATRKVEKDTKIEFAVDTSLVSVYNKEMTANYYPAPAGSYEISGTSGTITSGTNVSNPIVVRVVSTANFVDGRTYLIPVTIKNAEGPLAVLESSRTIFLRISRVIQFTSIDISNPNFYFPYPFQTPVSDIKAFTFEIKCFIDQWHPGTNQISRLCNWGPVNESMFNLLRFGEAGSEINQLQWINSSGNCFSKTLFSTQRWYTISCVYDGSTCRLFIDGNLDNSFDAAGQVYEFGALELGMSFAGYQTAQRFLGRIAEVRFWNRPLSRTEIQEGLCGVDVASNGLLAYWKFNEGSGNIFYDRTGNGRDMTWPRAVVWNNSSNNKCAQ